MSDEPIDEAGGEQAGTAPSEEEIRAQLDEQLRELRVEDVVLQSVASIINLTARRIAKPDERDLQQARIGIESVRALAPVLPEEIQPRIRDALSELQVLYAREARGPGPEAPKGEPGGGRPTPDEGPPPSAPSTSATGRRVPPKLWTPPGSG